MIDIEPIEPLVLYVYEKDILKHKDLSENVVKGFDTTLFSYPHTLIAAYENKKPDIIVLPFEVKERELMNFVESVKEKNQSIQIIAFLDNENEELIKRAMASNLIDDYCIKSEPCDWLNNSIKRALERFALINLGKNMPLKERASILKILEQQQPKVKNNINIVKFDGKLSESEWIKKFVLTVSEYNNFCPIIYLKYYGLNKTLHVFETSFVDKNKFKGIGLNLTQVEENPLNILQKPNESKEINEFLSITFNLESFISSPVYIQDQPQGVLIFADNQMNSQEISGFVQQLEMGLDCISLKSKLFNTSEKENDGKLLNKKSFELKISQEMKRCQRLSHPLSLVLIRFDAPFEMSQPHFFPLLQSFEKTSRSYETWGRISSRDIAVLIPHGDIASAKEKIKRLNSLIQMVMMGTLKYKMNFYFGVVEYPKQVGNALSMVEAAQSACDKSFEKGPHSVCEFKPEYGFNPEYSTSPYYSIPIAQEIETRGIEI